MMFKRMLLVLGGLALGGCVVDKQLGDTQADGGAGGSGSEEGSGTEGDPAGMSEGPGGSSTSQPGDDDDDQPGDDDDDDDQPGDDDDDDDDDLLCADWTPPPGDCETLGDAMMFVEVEPSLEDAANIPCTVGATASVDEDTDSFELECDGLGVLVFTVTTSPHVVPPLVTDQQVEVNAVETLENAVLTPSFTIRTPEGALLLAHHNEIDHEPDVDLSPLDFALPNSGCPLSPGDAECNAGEMIGVQRIPVEFAADQGTVSVFPGSSDTVSLDVPYFVIVRSAERIQCWDESCAGDDSGPFDELRFIAMAVNPE